MIIDSAELHTYNLIAGPLPHLPAFALSIRFPSVCAFADICCAMLQRNGGGAGVMRQKGISTILQRG